MSFAAELGQMAFDAKEAEVKRWVEVTLRDFRTQCKKRARRSKSSCTVDFKLPRLPSAGRNQAICLLVERLNELGFEDFDAIPFKFSKNMFCLQVKASWKVEPKTKIRQVVETVTVDANSQSGIVCHEDGHTPSGDDSQDGLWVGRCRTARIRWLIYIWFDSRPWAVHKQMPIAPPLPRGQRLAFWKGASRGSAKFPRKSCVGPYFPVSFHQSTTETEAGNLRWSGVIYICPFFSPPTGGQQNDKKSTPQR